MSDEDVLKRLESIEHQIKFLAEAYKTIHNSFIKGIHVNFERTLLEPNLSKLSSQMSEFTTIIHKLNEIAKNDSLLGTLAFMAKRLHEMEATLSQLKDEGLKKKIQLDFTVDGYEMIQRKSAIQDMRNENAEDSVKKLLKTLTEKESQTLIHRYGLFGKSAKTLEATSKYVASTRERVRQIQCKALRKCRHENRKHLVDALTHKDLKKDIMGEDE